MTSFFTAKLFALALVVLVIQLPRVGLSAGGPIEMTASLVGAAIGAIILASILKLSYVGFVRGVGTVHSVGSRAKN